jgi:RNA polymerase sigma-70 factor (ECF subfamily)
MAGTTSTRAGVVAEFAEQQAIAHQQALYLEVSRQFGPAIVRLARGYEAEPARRQDLVQEIHVALWRSLLLYDQRCSLRTWVYRIAHSTAARHVLVNRRIRARELQTLDEIAEPADHRDGVERLDRAVALQHLLSLIARLKPLDRQVILLYLEDFKADAISDVVGLSREHVATKVHRIKKLLGAMFHEGASQ